MALVPGDPVVGGTVLRRAAIESPNFSEAAQTGWAIMQDGSAFFYNITTRGSLIIEGTGQGWFIYNGTAALGNPPIAFSVAPGTTQDPFGNTLPTTGGGVVSQVPAISFAELVNGGLSMALLGALPSVQKAGIRIAQIGSGETLVMSSGNTGSVSGVGTSLLTLGEAASSSPGLTVLDGTDGNSYDTETLHLTAPGQNITSAALTPITGLSAPVAARTYRIHAVLNCTQGPAAAQQEFNLTGPAVAAGTTVVVYDYEESGTGEFIYGGTYNGALGNVSTPAYPISSNFDVVFDGYIEFTAGGTFQFKAAELGGQPFTINGGFCDLSPVQGIAGAGSGAISSSGVLLQILPSGDASGVTDTARINSAVSSLGGAPGTILLAPGQYWWTCGSVTVPHPEVYIIGAGRWATTINAVGTGDVLRMYNPTFGGGGFWSGGVLGLTIDGTSAGAGSAGLHLGDMEQARLDIAVQNFTGAGSIGVHLDNTIWWTEKLQGTIWARNCTSHVVFDVSGANTSTNSFGYLDLACYIQSQANQDGVVVQNGAFPYHGSLKIKGNFSGSASPVSNAVLRLTGTVPAGHPAAGSGSAISRSHLDIQVEVGSFANQPQTIVYGSAPTNFIQGCYGILDFTQGAGGFAGSNIVVSTAAGSLTFEGLIMGDSNLNPGGNFPQPVTIGTKQLAQAFMSGSNGNTFAEWGDFFRCTLSANITVNLAPAGQNTTGAPQRKTIIITQAAAGGPFTVTWPNPGSPTHASPAVRWAGGVAPVMSPAAGAVDVYKLETYDGATWYGEALQAVA